MFIAGIWAKSTVLTSRKGSSVCSYAVQHAYCLPHTTYRGVSWDERTIADNIFSLDSFMKKKLQTVLLNSSDLVCKISAFHESAVSLSLSLPLSHFKHSCCELHCIFSVCSYSSAASVSLSFPLILCVLFMYQLSVLWFLAIPWKVISLHSIDFLKKKKIGPKREKTTWRRKNLRSKEFQNLGTFHKKYDGSKSKAC